MMRKIIQFIQGSFVLTVLVLNTIVHCILVFVLAVLKLLGPTDTLRALWRKWLVWVAESWVSVNTRTLKLALGTRWSFEYIGEAKRDGCYLVNCNHQSWVDIPVLQFCLNRKLPFMRFFLKSQLIWVPLLGQAWWALDFPFMQRASSRDKRNKPSQRGKDLESARKACEIFRDVPVAMMNFAEGTRFTEAKREAGGAPYRNLLKPKIGGIGQVLFALGDKLDALVDVTLLYRDQAGRAVRPNVWQFVSGQLSEIVIRAEEIEIPQSLRSRNFRGDPQFRKELDEWISDLWRAKDGWIDQKVQECAQL